ncbi:MAG: preprotein translocase subunit SecG [Calditrichaeota bacterium]|nr:preprotein translocase subunit SecG [Calditrichota bacterium]
MLYGLLIAIQIIVSVLMVVAILLQNAKGGGLAGVAGGMASSTVFGGRQAANFLQRATTILAAVFMLNCLVMAMISGTSTQQTSVTQQAVQASPEASPVPSIPGGGQVSPVQPTQTAPAQSGEQPAEGN